MPGLFHFRSLGRGRPGNFVLSRPVPPLIGTGQVSTARGTVLMVAPFDTETPIDPAAPGLLDTLPGPDNDALQP